MRRRKTGKKSYGILIKILLAVFVISILPLLYFFILTTGVFNIREVEVKNEKLSCADENQIKDYLKLSTQNFFLLDSSKLEISLKQKFFCIKSVAVSRQFPGKILLEVSGRQPFVNLITLQEEITATPSAQLINDFYLVDGEGVIYSKVTDEINIPKIYAYNFESSLGKKIENNSLQILEKIKTFKTEVYEGWLYDDFLVINYKSLGLKIIFQIHDSIDIQLASLQLILDKAKIDERDLVFIDLRFDKPVVRFAPKKIVYG